MSTRNVSSGLHHVTAITSDPQRNVDFYTKTLGLRLVKLTVNFDDPSSYHFYYGDASGRPGTILTFFAWPGAYPARHGKRSVYATAFTVPAGSLGWWENHLTAVGVEVSREGERYGQKVLSFVDPDGMALELIESATEQLADVWEGSPIGIENAIVGFHSVTLGLDSLEATSRVLTELLGFVRGENVVDGSTRVRFTSTSEIAGVVDLLHIPDAERATTGVGGVHHVAFRAADDESQLEFQDSVRSAGLNVSPVLDRSYFHSIYFREPGGVLFEIATDAPGFTVDEPLETLGTTLKLPHWMESQRAIIEARVRPLELPKKSA